MSRLREQQEQLRRLHDCRHDLLSLASSWATRKIEIDEFPNAKRWLEEIGERPAVTAGSQVCHADSHVAEVRTEFAPDSLQEGARFELTVPLHR